MRSLPFRLLLLPMLGLFTLGASCNGKQSPAQGQEEPSRRTQAQAQVENLPQVDTSALTDSERRQWVDLVNDLLSPCGEPVSVAKCVAEARACRQCVPAARYTVRLVAEGFEKSEIQDLYADRYDAKKKLTIDTSEAPVKGAPMAALTIVEFSDFECPHCGAAHPVLSRTLDEFAGKVNLAFKHFPLPSHTRAVPAARAAYAAQQQGKFWEMADRLFEHQHELSDEKITGFAREIGLDLDKFEADRNSEAALKRVEQDKKDGMDAGVQGTPALYINGRPFKESVQNLSKYLKEELSQ